MTPMRRLPVVDAVVVVGSSMLPALEPGDRLLVESATFRRRRPRAGDVVLAPDPRQPRRELVKRVMAVRGEALILAGDGLGSTDSRTFGDVPLHAVRWRAAFRYWPLRRAGRIRRPPVSG